jgi:hypothetical protein
MSSKLSCNSVAWLEANGMCLAPPTEPGWYVKLYDEYDNRVTLWVTTLPVTDDTTVCAP